MADQGAFDFSDSWTGSCSRRGLTLLFTTIGLWAAANCSSRLSGAEPVYPLTAVATAGSTIYVSDLRLPGIWTIAAGKGIEFFRAAPRFRTPLNAVRCVRLDRKSRVLAGDSATRDVYRFDDKNQPQALTNGRIGIPMDIVENAAGELLVSDLESHRIWKVPATGGEPVEFAAIPAPRGMYLDADDRLWVVSHGKDQIIRIQPDGTQHVVVAGRPFQFPHEVVVLKNGSALVSDGYAKTIWKIPADGKPEPWIQGEPLQNPVGLCLHGDRLFIVDSRAKTVFEADADGKLSTLWNGKD